ncbi:unnamed protein product [Lactuca saligna]|uniref:Transposase MuDR plant domain-containing protein n=1 Tax=Lactuca saligna TaxID=75948 RepID=A0AA35YV17_LACSI|nr:unnamed protein product [Lactuca saligna]
MINFCSVLDEDIDLGQLDPTNNNTKEKEDIEDERLEVLDNDVFESFASEKEPRKKLLRSILKPVACSSGEVHTKAFKIGQTFKEKEKIREVIANYSVKERRDLHYVKNDKTRVRVKCRGIVPELTGDNRQKGILAAIEKLFPSAEQRAMEKLKKLNPEAHECLSKIPAKHWARSHFSGRALTDSLTNNLCENGSECGDPEAWVSKCYWLSTWNAMYQHTIDPINGRSMWPRSDCPTTLLPPKHHKQVGRPKKKRKRAVDEPTQSTKQSSHFTIINLASRLFLPRNNPGITTVDLGHMGGSNHPKKLHVPPNLEHDQNRRPGFKSVHDVTKIAGLPQWHITIFFNFGIECE